MAAKYDVLDFSLADFYFNDNPDILSPPEDFVEWMQDPRVQSSYRFFEQQLLKSPDVVSSIRSNIDGKEREIINLTSYNYLGLCVHPEVIQAAKDTIDLYGLSSSGAPMLSGSFDLHRKLAARLAAFKQQEACILFSSGLGGNIGSMQGLLRKGDTAILDELGHKSIMNGIALSGARMLLFKHNDMQSLEMMLEKAKATSKRILVIAEGVYSMDGDMAKLPEIVELCDAYSAGLYFDEAHSTLMFGESGRGVAEHFGLEHKIGISYGTMSKAFGGVGGFVCSKGNLIDYIKCYAEAWLFSAAPSPPVIGGMIKALEVATRDSSLRDKLWDNVHYMTQHLGSLGLNIGNTESQIIPIILGSSGELLFEMATEIQRRGIFMQPVDFPAVPADKRRFRISVSSQLTKEQMDRALNVIEDVVVRKLKEKGLLAAAP